MSSITQRIRPNIVELEPYTPIVPLDVLAARLGLPIEHLVKLDANENPYGPSPRAVEALSFEQHYAIYPDPDQTRLRAALSAYIHHPVERIICGAGADEVIDLLLRLFLNPGDVVIDCPPTFGMYAFDTGVCGGRVVTVPRHPDFSLNLEAIECVAEETQAKVLFLTSPNNPTGNLTAPSDIERLLRLRVGAASLPLLVVVDEAYIEFAEIGHGRVAQPSLTHPPSPSVMAWVGQYENLVVLRTFSKWAGLAGLRLGYGVASEPIATQLWKIKQPYNINVAVQAAAIASLTDLAYLQANVARIVAERERLLKSLYEISFLQPYPSMANFILCRVQGIDALQVKQRLEQQGILVRHYCTPLLRDYIRISVGASQQSEKLLKALQRFEGELRRGFA